MCTLGIREAAALQTADSEVARDGAGTSCQVQCTSCTLFLLLNCQLAFLDSLLNFERIGDENLVHLILLLTVLGSLAPASPQPWAAEWKSLVPSLKLVLDA